MALAIPLFLCAALLAQKSTPATPRRHFGVTLSPSVLAFWDDVEKGYGKPIQERSIDFAQTHNSS
jgi:hypothetical protein